MRTKSVLQELAARIQAMRNCETANNVAWSHKHAEAIRRIASDLLPSGSGVDSGTTIDLEKCTAAKIVLNTSFHHMNDGGCYDGWTEHAITLTPAFDGFDMRISGRDRNGIKEYLADLFHHALSAEYAAPVVSE